MVDELVSHEVGVELVAYVLQRAEAGFNIDIRENGSVELLTAARSHWSNIRAAGLPCKVRRVGVTRGAK